MTQAHFNEHASEYDQHAQIQASIANKLIASLNLSKEPKKILELGCGTGYVSHKLKSLYPEAQFTCCDISRAMLTQAKAKCGEKNFNYLECSFPEHDEKYDLIISSMALQWFPQLEDTFALAKKSLTARGQLVFSIPVEGTLEILPQSFARLGYTFEGLQYWEPNSLSHTLSKSLKVKNATHFSEVQSFKSAIDFMRNLHHIGANFNTQLSTAQLRRLLVDLDRKKIANALNAEYRILTLTAELGE